MNAAHTVRIGTPVMALLLIWPWVVDAKQGDSDRLGGVLASSGFRSIALERMRADFFVRVKINGRPAALVIDTGSPTSALDRKNVGGYAVKEEETSLGLNAPMGHSREHVGCGFPNIELANVVLSKEKVAVVELSAMNSGSPIYAGGDLGLDSMRKLRAIIDCSHSTLYVHQQYGILQSQRKLDDFLTSRGFTRVPMELNPDYLPAVNCQINSVRSKLVVGTATFTTILEKKVGQRAGLRLTDTGNTSEGVGNMKAPISSGIAREFFVGRFQTHNQKLSAENANFGVLGIDYLRAHDAVIDCGGMNLFLR
jgi:hypothetical protein